MKSYLKGRSLWCAASIYEIVPKDYEEINLGILEQSIKSLCEEQTTSIKLVCTRCLVKYSRKLSNDVMKKNIAKFDIVLDELSLMLDQL